MKVGDKVRFLNEKGGGTITAFRGKNIVMVEDADGFEIPMAVNDVIVVEADNYRTKTAAEKAASAAARAAAAPTPKPEPKPAPRPVAAAELAGRDKLNLILAFVPVSPKELSTTPFEAYLVNDSNYALYYNYIHIQNNACHLVSHGLLEPNSKFFLEEFYKSELNEREHMAVQAIAFKEGRSFALKPAVSAEIRIDPVKFFKVHTFQYCDFFNIPALLYPIVENDEPVVRTFVQADELRQALLGRHTPEERPQPVDTHIKKYTDGVVEVDLHAEALLDNMQGLQPADILRYQLDKFKEVMEKYKNRRGQRIVFIHGKGEGVLRKALLQELRRSYPHCRHQDASFQEYGFGATLVII